MRPQFAQQQQINFGGLQIGWDPRILEPRPWTAEQSRWIADLATRAPDGPILELCSGAGQIGLLAGRLTRRRLVQVDDSAVATAYARANAEAAGIDADVRERSLTDGLGTDESFPLIIVDPPWLTSEQLADFPEDPPRAVDGGRDGMQIIASAMELAVSHLHPRGHLVLQVGTHRQVSAVVELIRDTRVTVAGIRDHQPGGVLVHVSGAVGGSGDRCAHEYVDHQDEQ